MNDKINDVLTTKKTVFGFHVADLLGIALMVIPCLISLMHFPWFEKAVSWLPGWVPFNQREVQKQVLLPNMGTGLLATIFYYGAFIARYDIFKTENIIETLVSSVRTLLNCWGMASLFAAIITTDMQETFSIGIFDINTYSLLLFAFIFSWLGMKTIAGYSWIVFVVAGIRHFDMVSYALSGWGAVFIFVFALSMSLQVNSFCNIRDFINDFRNVSAKPLSQVRDSMGIAANDASVRAQEAAQAVKEKITDVQG